MSFSCPYKGSEKATKLCANDLASIGGWKRHMTRQHGGYDDTQLTSAVSGQGPSEANGKDAFMAELYGSGPELLPGDKTGEQADSPAQRDDGTAPAPAPPKKRVKFKPKAMRDFMAGLPEMFFRAKGIETDESDKKLLEAASEMMEELFGVAIEVPDSEIVIRSRWVAMLFPFAAILVVWGKHTFTLDFFKKDEEAKTVERPE